MSDEPEEKGGIFGGLKRVALSAGLLEEVAVPTASVPTQVAATPITPVTLSTTATAGTNPELVDRLRKIALAPANSPLTNTFMRHLDKAKRIESDFAQAIKVALMFSEIPVKDLVKEIETAIAANLSSHKMGFDAEIGAKRTDIDQRFSERQSALETAIAEDQARAEEIRQRLAKNTSELSSLAAEKATEIATVEKTASEAHASLSVVETEISALLSGLKAA